MVVQCNVHPSRTLDKLNKQRLTSSFTDVTVIVAGQHFSVHKALLAAHSSVFCTVLQDSSLSQATPNINLDGVESEYFSIILDFIYTSKLHATPTNVDQLHSTALFLQMQEVIDLCNKFKFSQKEEPVVHEVIVKLGNESKSETAKEAEVAKQTANHDQEQFQDKDSNNMMVEVFGSSEMEDIGVGRAQCREEFIGNVQQSETPTNTSGTKKLKKRGRKPQKRVTCEVCSRVMTKTKYEIHKRMHTGEKPYTCNDCGKQFVSIHNQRIHERIHTGERPYRCNLCDKAFSDPSTIRKHKLWHAGVKNKLCGMCGKYFATLTQVREHMRTHTKEKPYVCTECDKAYRYRCDLKRHMTEHTGNLIGPCNECGKYFNHRGNFLSHLRTHRKRNNSPLKLQDSGLVTSDGRIILKAKICDEALASAMLMVPAQQQSGSHRNVHDVTNQQSSSGMTSQNHHDTTSSDVLKVHDLSQAVTDGEIEVTINNGKFYVNQTSTTGLNEENGFLSESANEIILKEEDDITVATATTSTSSRGQLFGQQCETSLTADHVLMLVQDTQNLSEIHPSSISNNSSKDANSHSRSEIIITDEDDESLVVVDPNMT